MITYMLQTCVQKSFKCTYNWFEASELCFQGVASFLGRVLTELMTGRHSLLCRISTFTPVGEGENTYLLRKFFRHRTFVSTPGCVYGLQ